MKKLTLIFILLIGFFPLIYSQTIDSIKVEQAGELIKIHYRILNSNEFQVFKVTVFCSINGGLKSELRSLSGDFGDNVVGGRADYMVLWDVLKDVDEVNSVDFSVKAELLKDDTPITNSTKKVDWSKERIHLLFLAGGSDQGISYGVRLAYMDSWGVSGKFLFNSVYTHAYSLEANKIILYHTGIDLTKRIINKDGFSMHIMAGFSLEKVLTDEEESDMYTTFEIGTIMSIRRIAMSFGYSKYQNLTYMNVGIGIRF